MNDLDCDHLRFILRSIYYIEKIEDGVWPNGKSECGIDSAWFESYRMPYL